MDSEKCICTQDGEKYLLKYEEKHIYLEPVYEEIPEDKFNFMFEPAAILGYNLLQVEKLDYQDAINKYNKFGVLDMRSYYMKQIKYFSIESFTRIIQTGSFDLFF